MLYVGAIGLILIMIGFDALVIGLLLFLMREKGKWIGKAGHRPGFFYGKGRANE